MKQLMLRLVENKTVAKSCPVDDPRFFMPANSRGLWRTNSYMNLARRIKKGKI